MNCWAHDVQLTIHLILLAGREVAVYGYMMF